MLAGSHIHLAPRASKTTQISPTGTGRLCCAVLLSSVVAMKVNCDLQLTLIGSSLYRLLGAQIGGAYTTAESRHIWRDFINASARVTITDTTIEVRFAKRAHNPYLLDA